MAQSVSRILHTDEVRIASKAFWLDYYKRLPDAVGHPGMFGITAFGIILNMRVHED